MEKGIGLPAVRLSQYSVDTAIKHLEEIRPLARLRSPTLLTDCRQRGMPMALAEVVSGLLASVVDDLVTIGRLPRSDFERSKRLERVLMAAQQPSPSALRLGIAASPVNGRAAVRHWDVICPAPETGKFAWLLNMDTEEARAYARRVSRERR